MSCTIQPVATCLFDNVDGLSGANMQAANESDGDGSCCASPTTLISTGLHGRASRQSIENVRVLGPAQYPIRLGRSEKCRGAGEILGLGDCCNLAIFGGSRGFCKQCARNVAALLLDPMQLRT